MRCTNSLCQSDKTKRIEKHLTMVYNNGHIVGAKIDELWLCTNCGGPFSPGVAKVERWHSPFAKRSPRYIPKSWITRELFNP